MRSHHRYTAISVIVLVACGWLGQCQTALAMRLVRFEISVDGKVVLKASMGDYGEDPDTVWAYLKSLGLSPVNDYKVKPDEGEHLQATLKGKVRIYSLYGGDVTVNELKLILKGPGEGWKVSPKEVDRTLKARKKPEMAQGIIAAEDPPLPSRKAPAPPKETEKHFVTVVAESSEVRSSDTLIAKVRRGTRLEMLKRNEDYYLVVVEGKRGWISVRDAVPVKTRPKAGEDRDPPLPAPAQGKPPKDVPQKELKGTPKDRLKTAMEGKKTAGPLNVLPTLVDHLKRRYTLLATRRVVKNLETKSDKDLDNQDLRREARDGRATYQTALDKYDEALRKLKGKEVRIVGRLTAFRPHPEDDQDNPAHWLLTVGLVYPFTDAKTKEPKFANVGVVYLTVSLKNSQRDLRLSQPYQPKLGDSIVATGKIAAFDGLKVEGGRVGHYALVEIEDASLKTVIRREGDGFKPQPVPKSKSK